MKTFKTFMAVMAMVLVSTSVMAHGSEYDWEDMTTQTSDDGYTMSDKTLDSKLPGLYKGRINAISIKSDGTFCMLLDIPSHRNRMTGGTWQPTEIPGVYTFKLLNGETFEMTFFGLYLVDQSGRMWDRANRL